jgi:hypothetical protein
MMSPSLKEARSRRALMVAASLSTMVAAGMAAAIKAKIRK